jgi:hypothetical protein
VLERIVSYQICRCCCKARQPARLMLYRYMKETRALAILTSWPFRTQASKLESDTEIIVLPYPVSCHHINRRSLDARKVDLGSGEVNRGQPGCSMVCLNYAIGNWQMCKRDNMQYSSDLWTIFLSSRAEIVIYRMNAVQLFGQDERAEMRCLR